jgi:hypothetical protein
VDPTRQRPQHAVVPGARGYPPPAQSFNVSVQRRSAAIAGSPTTAASAAAPGLLLQRHQSCAPRPHGAPLTANINSPVAVAAGTRALPGFDLWNAATVRQALRRYPQFLNTIPRPAATTAATLPRGMVRVEKIHERRPVPHLVRLLQDHRFRRLPARGAADPATAAWSPSASSTSPTTSRSAACGLPIGRGKLVNERRRHRHRRLAHLGVAAYSSGRRVSAPPTRCRSRRRPRSIIAAHDGWRPATKGGDFDPPWTAHQPASFFPRSPNLRQHDALQPEFRSFPNFNENFARQDVLIHESLRVDFAPSGSTLSTNALLLGSLTIQS